MVDDPDEKARALGLIVDHMIPGRSATLRANTRKELAATAVLAVPLHEASLKVRDGGPVDDPRTSPPASGADTSRCAGCPGRPCRPPTRGVRSRTTWSGAWASSRLDRLRAMSVERTLVILKPDAVRRGLVGEILSRFEAKGLSIVAMEHRTIDGALADEHYAEHVERDFYPPLRAFVTSGPMVSLVLEGDEAVDVVRALNGATDGRTAAPARSGATSSSPTARTSCTARTRPSPPSARSRSGSPAL